MSVASAFLVRGVPVVSEERRRELVANLWKLTLVGADALVGRFGEKPEEFAAMLSETVIVPANIFYRRRLCKLREWWNSRSVGNDPSCLARSLVQRLMEGPNPGVRFDAGRELLIKMLLIRAHQCGVFAE